QETRRASRYDAVIATLVGLCALCFVCFRLYRPRTAPASACRGVAHPRIRQRQRAYSIYTRQQRGRTGDYPARHPEGGWPAGEELEGGPRENTRTWGASGFGERHEWSCVRRG